jgi:hypothetical protein
MGITYRIRGYQKEGSALLFERDLPDGVARGIQRAINGKDDPELFGPHPLDPAHIHKIATALERPIDTEGLEFFIEAVADWDTIRKAKRLSKIR